jgi:hypothetical protein
VEYADEPPARQLATKRARRNSKSKYTIFAPYASELILRTGTNPGDQKGKSRKAASAVSKERRSGNPCEVEGILLDVMALDDDGESLDLGDPTLTFFADQGHSREPSRSRHASRPQSPESERASSCTREPVNSSFAPPAAQNSLWTHVNLSPPANTSTPADQPCGGDGSSWK